jgi:hypothetical protein
MREAIVRRRKRFEVVGECVGMIMHPGLRFKPTMKLWETHRWIFMRFEDINNGYKVKIGVGKIK